MLTSAICFTAEKSKPERISSKFLRSPRNHHSPKEDEKSGSEPGYKQKYEQEDEMIQLPVSQATINKFGPKTKNVKTLLTTVPGWLTANMLDNKKTVAKLAVSN